MIVVYALPDIDNKNLNTELKNRLREWSEDATKINVILFIGYQI